MDARLNFYSYAVVSFANGDQSSGFTVKRRNKHGHYSYPEMKIANALYPLNWSTSQCAWSWIDRGMAEKHPWWA